MYFPQLVVIAPFSYVFYQHCWVGRWLMGRSSNYHSFEAWNPLYWWLTLVSFLPRLKKPLKFKFHQTGIQYLHLHLCTPSLWWGAFLKYFRENYSSRTPFDKVQRSVHINASKYIVMMLFQFQTKWLHTGLTVENQKLDNLGKFAKCKLSKNSDIKRVSCIIASAKYSRMWKLDVYLRWVTFLQD